MNNWKDEGEEVGEEVDHLMVHCSSERTQLVVIPTARHLENRHRWQPRRDTTDTCNMDKKERKTYIYFKLTNKAPPTWHSPFLLHR